MSAPIIYRWHQGRMEPLQRFHNLCASQFVEGEHYRLSEIEERSLRSHQHYFAAISTAWQNLPEEYAQEFASPEALRKWALIKTGYCNRDSIALDSHDDALKVAAWARRQDEFAVVSVSGSTVTRYTAKSQSYRAMPKGEFQASKQAVLDFLDDILSVERGQVHENAGQAA